MKDKFFFPLVLILALFAIYIAIKPPQFAHANSVFGQNIGDKIVITGDELNKIDGNRPFIIRESSRVNGKALGPRIIAEDKIAIEGMNGAKIIFDDKIKQAIAQKSLKLVIIAMPIKNSEPKNIGIGIYGNGKTIWQSMATPQANTPIIFEFNDEIQNKEGIIINPSLEGGAKGIELQAIAIKIL